jgi:hypothetical protein
MENDLFLGAANGFLLSKFISSVIERRASSFKKDYCSDKEGHQKFDYFLPKGFSPFTNGPTFVEMFMTPNFLFPSIFSNLKVQGKYQYLFFSNCIPPRNFKFPSNVVPIFRDKLRGIINENPVEAYIWLNRDCGNITTENFEDFNSAVKKEIKKVFRIENPAFIFGAGVSRDYGSPSWKDLLASLKSEAIKKGGLPKETQLFDFFGNSAIILGQFFQEFNNNQMSDTIYRYLFPKNAAFDESRSTVLMEAAKLIERQCSKGRIPVVLTYNYDNYLESAFNSLKMNCYPVFDGNIPSANDRLLIFHPNGFIPNNGGPFSYLHSKDIVFGEDSYNRLMADPYSWGQVLQSKVFIENRCLFIGNSMTDPDLRLLLKRQQKTSSFQGSHFAFMLKEKLGLRELVYFHRFLTRFGIQCVWFNTSDDERLFLERLGS